jgi:GT2 family glycosyltransferase
VSTEPAVTAGICTRDRPAALLRCLRSLEHAGGALAEVVVVDDGSAAPLEAEALRRESGLAAPLEVIRSDAPEGPARGRNRIADLAAAPYLLYLDDDAALLPGEALADALAVLECDPAAAVVAFAQADAEGVPYPAGAQPSPAEVPSRVAAFIGFAHLVRRDALLAVGGYREILEINGEERELSLRLLDAGHHVVYLPGASVAHLPDPTGRDLRRFLHLTVRNDLLIAWLNEPLPLALAGTPVRLARYLPMRRAWRVEDPGGFRRILRALAGALPRVLRERRAVRWSTVREWRRLRASPPYEGP